MRYMSVCSGIEAATVAWHHMGWTPAWFSEIEPFPSAVLKHHYPTVPNVGDMTKYGEWPDESVDLLVGGTPCQSFSVAGLRAGLADPRGGLMLTYLEIARRYRPRWIVWENVPGVLSSNGGRDFGSFLGALGQLGYGFAYRVLDAQWFGVAQRRRRVFVVGHFGDWRRAAKVLFESESVCRDTPPSRKTGEETAQCLTAGVGKRYDAESETLPVASTQPAHYRKSRRAQSSEDYETWVPDEATNTLNCFDVGDIRAVDVVMQPIGVPDVMATLLSSTAGISRPGNAVTEHETYIPMAIPIHDQATRFAGKRGDKQDGKGNGFGVGASGDPAPTLTKGDKHAVAQSVAYVGGIDFENNAHTMEEPTGPLLKGSPTGGGHPLPAIAFAQNQLGEVRMGAVTNTLNTNSNASGRNTPMVQSAMQVRRLTPTECERLQGFPDGYTNIPWRKSQESPDGPRYKALGNSMAVPVMRWIGERINKVDNE